MNTEEQNVDKKTIPLDEPKVIESPTDRETSSQVDEKPTFRPPAVKKVYKKSGERGDRRYRRGRYAWERIDVRNLVINYKRPDVLKKFITEQGKILPRRITDVSAKDQRKIVREIRRARFLAFLPFRNR